MRENQARCRSASSLRSTSPRIRAACFRRPSEAAINIGLSCLPADRDFAVHPEVGFLQLFHEKAGALAACLRNSCRIRGRLNLFRRLAVDKQRIAFVELPIGPELGSSTATNLRIGLKPREKEGVSDGHRRGPNGVEQLALVIDECVDPFVQTISASGTGFSPAATDREKAAGRDNSSDVNGTHAVRPEILRCRAGARESPRDRRSRAGRGPCRRAADWQVRAQWPCLNSGRIPWIGTKKDKAPY